MSKNKTDPVVNIGLHADDHHGDELRVAFDKINKAFRKIYGWNIPDYGMLQAIQMRGAPDGYAPLDGNQKVPNTYLPAGFAGTTLTKDEIYAAFQTLDKKGIAQGYPPLDISNHIPPQFLPSTMSVPRYVYDSMKGMYAASKILKKGDLVLVNGDKDKNNDGEYVVLVDGPSLFHHFSQLGAFIPIHHHDGDDVDITLEGKTSTLTQFAAAASQLLFGVLQKDGSIAMDPSYKPADKQDVVTKGYVDGIVPIFLSGKTFPVPHDPNSYVSPAGSLIIHGHEAQTLVTEKSVWIWSDDASAWHEIYNEDLLVKLRADKLYGLHPWVAGTYEADALVVYKNEVYRANQAIVFADGSPEDIAGKWDKVNIAGGLEHVRSDTDLPIEGKVGQAFLIAISAANNNLPTIVTWDASGMVPGIPATSTTPAVPGTPGKWISITADPNAGLKNWINATKISADHPITDSKEGDFETILEKDKHGLKVFSSGVWHTLFDEEDIHNWIASLSLFKGTVDKDDTVAGFRHAVGTMEEKDLPDLVALSAAGDATTSSHYWTWMGGDGHTVTPEDTRLDADLHDAILNNGDWLQIVNKGGDGTDPAKPVDLHWVTVGGDLLSKGRGDGLYGLHPWLPGSYESGSLVTYQNDIYRATDHIVFTDKAPAEHGAKWTKISISGGLRHVAEDRDLPVIGAAGQAYLVGSSASSKGNPTIMTWDSSSMTPGTAATATSPAIPGTPGKWVPITGDLTAKASNIVVDLPTGKQSLQYLIDNMLDEGLPIGSISFWPKKDIPEGWLLCDGSKFNVKKYRALSKFLGGHTMPDYRDQFIRATGDARDPGTKEDWMTGQAKTPFAVAIAGHSHDTNTTGDHGHKIFDYSYHVGWDGTSRAYYGTNQGEHSSPHNDGPQYTRTNGGNHKHSVSGGDHKHDLTGGDAETRPDNVALNIIMKASIVAGQINGILPIRYEGTVAKATPLVQLNEQCHKQLLVFVNGEVLQKDKYSVFEDQVIFNPMLGIDDKYVIINYATSAADPHHIYDTIADMLADKANIKAGEVSMVKGEPDKYKNGEYIALEDLPVDITKFRHLGSVNGVLRLDGTLQMELAYNPTQEQDVVTKKYFDDNNITDYIGRINGESDMDDSYLPVEDQDVATVNWVQGEILGEMGVRDGADGYAGLGHDGIIPINLLPPDKAIPRHIYATYKEMRAAHHDLKKGDFVLVDNDPDPDKNSEYTVMADNPGLKDFKNMADYIARHQHGGADVIVDTPSGKQNMQYVADNLMAGGAPIGSITTWPTAVAPPGWLLCDGADFDPLKYRELSRILGGHTTPDLSDKFIRGAGAARLPLSEQVQATSGPTNPFRTELLGNHVHNVPGSGGGHVHDLNITNLGQNGDHLDTNKVASGYSGTRGTRNAGAKIMWTSGAGSGQHTHTMSRQGEHDHSIDRGGDSETRPANTALWYIIRAFNTSSSEGIVPIRYEGVTAPGQIEIPLNEVGNKNLLLMLGGVVIPTSRYDIVGDKLVLKNPITTAEMYTIVNYASGSNDPHHVYENLAEMIADVANIELGEIAFVHADPDITKNGEWVCTSTTPTAEADFSHLGFTIRPHTHTSSQVTGVVKTDGTRHMNTGYVPAVDLDVATKAYVDDLTGGVLHGTAIPASTLGKDGDIYYRHAPVDIDWMVTTGDDPAVASTHGYRVAALHAIGSIVIPPETHGVVVEELIYSSGFLAIKIVTKNASVNDRIRIGMHTLPNVPVVVGDSLTYTIMAVPADIKAAIIAHTPFELVLLEAPAVKDAEYEEYNKHGTRWIKYNPVMADGSVDMVPGYVPKHDGSVVTKAYVDAHGGVVHHGTATPDPTLGIDGDMYLEHPPARIVWSLTSGAPSALATIHGYEKHAIGADMGSVTTSGDAHDAKIISVIFNRVIRDLAVMIMTPHGSSTDHATIDGVDLGAPVWDEASHTLLFNPTATTRIVMDKIVAGTPMDIILHSSPAVLSSEYEEWIKKGGRWQKYVLLLPDGTIPMDAGYVPVRDNDLVTKEYVDTIPMAVDAVAAVTPKLIRINSFYINELGLLRFKQADGTIKTVTLS